jgi:hypothetical protein
VHPGHGRKEDPEVQAPAADAAASAKGGKVMDNPIDVLARILHESGREAVAQRKIYRDDVPIKPFAEWADLPEPAKEGRRMMARYLVDRASDVRRALQDCL